MENLNSYDDFLNENSEDTIELFEGFQDGVDTWFDDIAGSNTQWKQTKILSFTKMNPTTDTFNKLLEYVKQINNELPGKNKFIEFLNDNKSKKYSNEMKKFDGKGSIVSEILSLLRQALEY